MELTVPTSDRWPTGAAATQAHPKSTGDGSGLTHRVYLLGDTGGVTGMVQVGFIGPHFESEGPAMANRFESCGTRCRCAGVGG